MYSIKNLLLSLWLMAFSSFTYAECDFNEARFNYEGGSEYLYTLSLNKDGTLILHHEMWLPGKADDVQLVEHIGSWGCKGNIIFMTISNQTHTAIYEAVGKNPIGINPKIMSLKFSPSSFKLGELVLLKLEA